MPDVVCFSTKLNDPLGKRSSTFYWSLFYVSLRYIGLFCVSPWCIYVSFDTSYNVKRSILIKVNDFLNNLVLDS